METTLLELTHRYARDFDQRNIEALKETFDEDANLIDPSISIGSREEIISFVENLYSENPYINFLVTNIIAIEKERFSVIEFILEIGKSDSYITLRGTDHIYWSKQQKIEKLEAFLYPVEVE